VANREDVFNALAALLADVPGIGRVTRRMQMPSLMDAVDLVPGSATLMVWEHNEDTKQRGRGTPSTRTWEAYLVVYFKNPDQTIPGATIINPILEGIEAALEPLPSPANTQTLGGLVSHAWIEGVTTIALGDVDTQGFGGCVVPVKILVP
jgi:hypothetical protein